MNTRSALALMAMTGLACGSTDNVNNNNQNNNNNNTNPPALSSIALEASVADALAVGATANLTVTATYDDMSTKDLTAMAGWETSDAAVATVDAGVVTAVAPGDAVITATYEGLSATWSVNVAPPTLVKVELIPASGEIGMGGFLNIEALAEYSDGSRDIVTETVEWNARAPNVVIASATEKGRLVTFGEGSGEIVATLDGVEGRGTYTVVGPKVEYLTVGPGQVRLEAGTPVQFTAEAFFTDERRSDVTNTVVWSSSDETIAVIDQTGLASAVGDGDVVITATIDGVSSSVIARTLSITCPYPADASDRVAYNEVMPALFTLDAVNQDGELADFNLAERYCNASENPTIAFVIGAGWCPYCPDYKLALNELREQVAAAGMLVVYVEIETNSGAPANNMQAHDIVNRTLTTDVGASIRIGDGAIANSDRPFSRAVQAIPSAFVVRTSDMRVIASQARSSGTLDFVQIANNPDRLY